MLVVSLAAPGLAGCGTTVLPGDTNSDRLAVTDALRTACEGWDYTDAHIQLFIDAVEQDRLAGASEHDERVSVMAVYNVMGGYWTNDAGEPATCLLAVIDQLYDGL